MFIGTIASVASAIPSILEVVSTFHNKFINQDGILIAYKYEIESNKKLLREVNMDELSKTDITSPEFRNLVMNLQTQVGISILYDADRKNHKSFMSSLERNIEKFTPEKETDEKEEEFDTLKKAMVFSVEKIEHIKRLAICASEGKSLFNNFNLKTRMNNILKSLIEISKALEDIKL